MERTIVEKIFQDHLVQGKCEVGEIIECEIDLIMAHEMLGDQIHRIAREAGLKKIWDPGKVVTILDHWVPASSPETATIHQEYRKFVNEYGIIHDLGMNQGICHVALPELGFIKPGMLMVGSDSHTITNGALNCFATGLGSTDATIVLAKGKNWFKVPSTVKISLDGKLKEFTSGKDVALALMKRFGTDGLNYKSMELKVVNPGNLPVSDRFTISNMGVEMGAKCSIFKFDPTLESWLKDHGVRGYKPVSPDEGANYESIEDIDMDNVEPMVALPPNPANVKPVSEIEEIEVDQVFIGSCTNGRVEDIRIAAKILGDKKINEHLRCIVIPASRGAYLTALKEGLIEKFTKAGVIVEYPNCGPCMGGHMGILGPGETCVSTSNRNFPGRMGSKEAKIFLVSPATAIASAIAGKIVDPRRL
ncbi:MAG: 3-isopropylmalate dehydratase large subunit [Candidatus Hodarchaeota archaeon]